jgi:hypothetical protein
LSAAPVTLNLKIKRAVCFNVREEGAEIMENINAFTGVGVAVKAAAGMSRTLHVAAVAAHPAHPAHAATGAAAAITPQRKRRTAAATRPSVDWGTI